MEDKDIDLVFIGNLTLEGTVLPSVKTNSDSIWGAALYSAIGAKIWSKHVGMVSRIGQDYSSSNLRLLESLGIDTTGITRIEPQKIHDWALYTREGHCYFILKKEGGKYLNTAPTPSEIPMRYQQNARGFHINPMPLASQEEIVEKLSLLPAIITLNPHHEWLKPKYLDRWKRLLRKVDIFLPSEDEFITFWGIQKKNDPARYKEWIKNTAALGPGIVVLNLRERGVLLYDAIQETFYHVPSVEEKVIDITGRWDAFCGGFLSGYIQTSHSLIAALFGLVSSSFVIEDFSPLHVFDLGDQQIQDRFSSLYLKQFI